jgi:hypothetical protein
MKRILAFSVVLASLAAPVLADDVATPGLPRGWQFGGTPESYEVGTAVMQRMKPGTQVAYIKALPNANCGTYGALFQTISAEKYRGKQVRLSARINKGGSTYAAPAANMFLFVRRPGGPMPVSYGDGGPGTAGDEWWRMVSVVSVPMDAEQIIFGFRLSGPNGNVLVDEVRFETLGDIDPNPPLHLRPFPDTGAKPVLFRGYRCGTKRDWLSARGLLNKDERDLLTAPRRMASADIQLALSRP